MNRNQWIGVFVGLGVLSYLLFSDSIMGVFNPSSEDLVADVSQAEIAHAGVVVEEEVVGGGELVAPGDILTVHYIGTFEDGQVFDSSLDRNTPFSFTLGVGQVIRGWDEGLLGMRVGGKRMLKITPDYAYGEQGVGSVPPNTNLIFEVEVLDAQKSEPSSVQ